LSTPPRTRNDKKRKSKEKLRRVQNRPHQLRKREANPLRLRNTTEVSGDQEGCEQRNQHTTPDWFGKRMNAQKSAWFEQVCEHKGMGMQLQSKPFGPL